MSITSFSPEGKKSVKPTQKKVSPQGTRKPMNEPSLKQSASSQSGLENTTIHLQLQQQQLNDDVNDPSAGSPTETLLRLLLPLNDKVQTTSWSA